MKINKRLGIHLNYHQAHIIEFNNDPFAVKTISSDFTELEKSTTLLKGEKTMHHTEQHDNVAYFKKLENVIKEYDEVILFRPTKAKDELHNILKVDSHFSKIDIEAKTTDDLKENEQHQFVMNYFSKKLSPNSI